MAHLLSAEKISLDYPTRQVLESVTCGIDDGDRVGIVGRNGDGKSSLLSILVGHLEPSTGQVRHRNGLRIGYLSQSDDMAQMASASVEQGLFGAKQRYEWASDPRIRGIVDGLLAGMDLDSRIEELSGGERRKVALAAVLVGDWDVIGLDEPTNHLDLEAIWWLAGHLKSRWPSSKGGLLVVTHDRWFLDEVARTTWEVHDTDVDPFSGGYAAYILARVERDRQAAAIEAKRQNLMRKELAWLRRGAPARTSKPRFRIEAANVLIEDVPEIRNSVSLAKMAVARLGKKVIDMVDVSFSYPGTDRLVIDDATWRVAPGERTGILGPNGAGKSTLLELLTGQLHPTSGRVTRGQTVRVGVLDQTYAGLEEIQEDLVREVVARLKNVFQVDGKEVSPGQLLERLGFSSEHLSARVSQLSGGQKRRLQILLVLCAEPNVLILDEPTNDVDTEMLTALEDLLDSWPGTVIVVSHDRYFVERVTDQQYAVLDSRLRHLPGGIDEYLGLVTTPVSRRPDTPVRRLDALVRHPDEVRIPGARGGDPASGRRTRADGGTTSADGGTTSADGGTTRADGGTTSQKTNSNRERTLRKKLAQLENKLAKANDLIASLSAQMAMADHSDWMALQGLTGQIDQAQAARDEVEEQWFNVAQELEGE